MTDRADIAVLGAGAAGLMAAIWAGRAARDSGRPLTIVALDGARKPGAKILVAGGGRCNVTHHAVDESAYAGSTRPAIRKVLGRFDVPRTVAFFRELGVDLKREETGKLFPTTDTAHTVLNSLLTATSGAGAQLRHPWRVEAVQKTERGFLILPSPPAPGDGMRPHPIESRRVILATGGCALPRSGSDGHGYSFATALGHTLTPRIFPALVPLTLPRDHALCALAGIAAPASIEVRSGAGRRIAAFTNSTLCTHFGLSGPAVLDISRYYLDARAADPGTKLIINWLPSFTSTSFDRHLQDHARQRGAPGVARTLAESLPERLARAVCELAGLDPSLAPGRLSREQRQALVRAATELDLPVSGDRGFTYAEVTAGGVPLSEVRLDTLESRFTPGLHLCGEILDVDGRIGGFNFQWAWASGFVAGSGAAASLLEPVAPRT